MGGRAPSSSATMPCSGYRSTMFARSTRSIARSALVTGSKAVSPLFSIVNARRKCACAIPPAVRARSSAKSPSSRIGILFTPPLSRLAARLCYSVSGVRQLTASATARNARNRRQLGWEEVDRLRRGDAFDVALLALEQQHSLHELLFELLVVELRRDDLALRDAAVRLDGQLQDELALERRVLAQRSVVERIDRALVDVEDALDLLAAARGLVALTGALRSTARDRKSLDGALDLRRGAIADTAAACVAARCGRVDAAAARADSRRNERALADRRSPLSLARDLRLVEPLDRLVVAAARDEPLLT